MAEMTPEPGPSLAVDYFDERSTPVLRLTGELDASTVDKAREALDAIPDSAGRGIVFDVAGLTFMDSSGLALLLTGLRRFGGVRLRRPPPLISQVVRMTGLADFLPVE